MCSVVSAVKFASPQRSQMMAGERRVAAYVAGSHGAHLLRLLPRTQLQVERVGTEIDLAGPFDVATVFAHANAEKGGFILESCVDAAARTSGLGSASDFVPLAFRNLLAQLLIR